MVQNVLVQIQKHISPDWGLYLGLDNFEALILSSMMFPKQDPAARHHASMFPASTLDVQHQVVAHAPGVMIVFLLISNAFKSSWKLPETIVFVLWSM